uniref:Uncharacterized protein n=1 Tax=Lotharella globosa TaxID=91324 RepID=A0A7S3Z4F1_9EUKA
MEDEEDETGTGAVVIDKTNWRPGQEQVVSVTDQGDLIALSSHALESPNGVASRKSDRKSKKRKRYSQSSIVRGTKRIQAWIRSREAKTILEECVTMKTKAALCIQASLKARISQKLREEESLRIRAINALKRLKQKKKKQGKDASRKFMADKGSTRL